MFLSDSVVVSLSSRFFGSPPDDDVGEARLPFNTRSDFPGPPLSRPGRHTLTSAEVTILLHS